MIIIGSGKLQRLGFGTYVGNINVERRKVRENHEDKWTVLFIDNINEHFVVILYIMIVMFVVSLLYYFVLFHTARCESIVISYRPVWK